MKLSHNGNFSIAEGAFKGTLDSLGAYECPEWFKDAKFGIWSHWGPQSAAMYGDWYARKIYLEGSDEYRYHCRKYGHPSQFGYKDLIPLWKAEKFDPHKLMKLFRDAGAQYFVAQAMHHDNFDNFNSTFQPRFNSVHMGPKRDIVGEWKEAAASLGLKFGLSEHLAGSPGFMHAAKGCDTKGKYKGVPYDGNLPEYFDLYFDETNVDMAWEKSWFCTKEEFYWQTCTSFGDWFYNLRDRYKTWFEVMEMLVDNVSKNGNLLINVPQLPDGTLDEECEWMLQKLASWMKINGEGIFGTRPFRTSGEGEARFVRKSQYDDGAVAWQPGDVRYTQKGGIVYAFLMRWPGDMAILRSLPYGKERVRSVELLGAGALSFSQTGAGLIARLPDGEPSDFVSCLKLTLEE